MISTKVYFTILDYFFFAIVFIVSTAVGLFYAFGSKKNFSAEDYLFGGKNLKVIPVSFSLAVTAISGSAIIGHSMEVYAYGLHAWITLFTCVICAYALQYIFVPVFYDLQYISSFEYLENRFDKSVKNIASALYVLNAIFLIPVTIYVPALAFQEVTGINLYAVVVVTGLLCIWYTAIGGIKAVVWTDVFQYILIAISSLVILIVGLQGVGGIGNVWDTLNRRGRLTFTRFDFDLKARGTIWSYFLSHTFILINHVGISQSSLQRFLSLPRYSDVKIAIWGQFWLCEVILIVQFTIGGIIYTTYEHCDPLTAGLVKKVDQIFPHFVQEKASLFAGFNGIFIAGIFAAGLSTTSTLLNTISGTIYSDFIASRIKKNSDGIFIKSVKFIVAIVGIIAIALVFLIEKLGTIFAITMQCYTLSAVCIFGVFACGILFRKINSRGAKCGLIAATLVVGTLIIGGLSKYPDPVLPLLTDGCNFSNGTTESGIEQQIRFSENTSDNSSIPWIFQINFQYYCFIGLVINLSVAYFVSILTGGNDVKDERFLAPFLRRTKNAEDTLIDPTIPPENLP
ncbi:hypothetical protein DMENIID0001_020810 [Sergentomyia squamirostris]